MKTLLAALWLAHSWYPTECCSERDCHAVSDAQQVEGGWMAEGLFYPDAIVKPSQDGNYHACYIPGTKRTLCFFVPFAV